MEEKKLIYYRRATSRKHRYKAHEMTPEEVIVRRDELRYLLKGSKYDSLNDMQLDDSRMVVVKRRYMIFEDPDGYERYISREKKPPSEAQL